MGCAIDKNVITLGGGGGGGGGVGPWFTIMDEAILGGEHFVSNVLLNDEAVDFPKCFIQIFFHVGILLVVEEVAGLVFIKSGLECWWWGWS